MFCDKCGKNVADNAIFCGYCGNEILRKPLNVKENLVCPKCNIEFTYKHVFCDKCGAKLAVPQSPAAKPQNDLPNDPKINYRASILFGLAICLGIFVLFLVLWLMGIIDW